MMSLYFDNVFGLSIAQGSVTNCPSAGEFLNLELFHDHALKFKIVTPFAGKRWFIWRFKDIVKCWFCESLCSAIQAKPLDPALKALNSNGTGT
jgi:hypothetical protein